MIDVRGFNGKDKECLIEMNSALDNGLKFDNVNDYLSVIRSLVHENTLESNELYAKLVNGKHLPEEFEINIEEPCAICGSPIIVHNDDSYYSKSCIVCNNTSNQYVSWEKFRATSENVLIWSAFFEDTSVCNELALEGLLREIQNGAVPDRIKYKGEMYYNFVDSFMNETIVNHRMSEYEKFINTMLVVQFNADKERVKSLAESILFELHKLDEQTYTTLKEVEPRDIKVLARMDFNM